MRVMSDFDKKTMLLAKLMSENEYLAPVPAAMRNPRVVFREYAELHFKPEPLQVKEARERLKQAIKHALENAEAEEARFKRWNRILQARKWHRRCWNRKGW